MYVCIIVCLLNVPQYLHVVTALFIFFLCMNACISQLEYENNYKKRGHVTK